MLYSLCVLADALANAVIEGKKDRRNETQKESEPYWRECQCALQMCLKEMRDTWFHDKLAAIKMRELQHRIDNKPLGTSAWKLVQDVQSHVRLMIDNMREHPEILVEEADHSKLEALQQDLQVLKAQVGQDSEKLQALLHQQSAHSSQLLDSQRERDQLRKQLEELSKELKRRAGLIDGPGAESNEVRSQLAGNQSLLHELRQDHADLQGQWTSASKAVNDKLRQQQILLEEAQQDREALKEHLASSMKAFRANLKQQSDLQETQLDELREGLKKAHMMMRQNLSTLPRFGQPDSCCQPSRPVSDVASEASWVHCASLAESDTSGISVESNNCFLPDSVFKAATRLPRGMFRLNTWFFNARTSTHTHTYTFTFT